MSAVSELSETDDGSFLRCCLYLRRYFRRMSALLRAPAAVVDCLIYP